MSTASRGRRATRFVRPFSVVALAAILSVPFNAAGQEPRQPDMTIDAAVRTEVIETLIKQLNEKYVFPEVAKKMESALRQKLREKEYDRITSSTEFAQALTTHVQEVSKDKHLRVRYSSEAIPERRERQPSQDDEQRFRRAAGARNHGFAKVERLQGNIGYLELRNFLPAEVAGDTAVAAMNFLANSEALIIDLRSNGGGAPSMVAFLSSYLFGAEPVHLNDLYFRPDDSTHQWWTLPYVPGQRSPGKDVYVLTSKRTFSAAEEFTYNLKNLKRATIVGEVTGGGAHPGGGERLSKHFMAFVPSGRAINPISKTNWEGKGVEPDIAVPAEQALKVAHLTALKKVQAKGDMPPFLADEVRSAIHSLEKETAPRTSAEKQ